uniref:Uncharacterized protein n=1 Tax=Desulfobacca acetoxidans TaxID=60893 RepID=A0A7C5AMU5_9BACT
MTSHGFNFSASCGGKGSYTKWIRYQGKRAYISVTDKSGESFPTSLEEPIRVSIHDLKTGEEVEPPREFVNLDAFLATLKEAD